MTRPPSEPAAPTPAPAELPPAAPPDAPLRTSEMYDQSWLGSLLRPLLIVVMVGCFALVLTTLLARFTSDLPQGFFVGLAVLAFTAAIVGSATTTVLAQPSRRAYRSIGYRAAEVGLFLAATRLYVWFASGQWPDMGPILVHPLDVLLDLLFVAAALIVGLSWFFAVEMTDDFSQLALRADELLHGKPRHGLADESIRARGVDRSAVLGDFTIRWVTLGLVMIMLAALLRRGIAFNGLFGLLRQDVELSVLAPIIVYFVAGLLLLSNGRLALLRSRWTMEQTPAQPDVSRRWPWEVIALVGGMALLALLLPLGGTFLLATILSTVLSGLFVLVLLLYRLGATAVLWLFSLVAGEPAPPAQNVLPPTQSVQAPQTEQFHAVLPPWAGGAFFWSVVVLLVAYATYVYLRDRGVRFAWLEWLRMALGRRWGDLRAALKRTQQRLNPARSLGGNSRARPNLFAFGRRSWDDPDRQVRYLYLSTLRNAEQAGLPRRPGETPYGYAPRLAHSLEPVQTAIPAGDAPDHADEPSAETDITLAPSETSVSMDALTHAFVDVRYAGSHADATLVSRLQNHWERLQKALHDRARR